MQLEKIFEENPMARYDPEQLQEFLNVKKIKKRKNIPPFQQLIMPVKNLTSIDNFDGLKLEMGTGIGGKLMLQGGLTLSNKDPPNFSLQSVYHNGTQFSEGTAMVMM